MKRVTATMLEAFRRYKDNEYMSFDDMVAAIKGTTEVNDAMLLGTAVHEVLENYTGYQEQPDGSTSLVSNPLNDSSPHLVHMSTLGLGHNIDMASIAEHHKWLDSGWLREVETAKGLDISGEILHLKCKADAVAGTTVVDHKVTTKPINDAMIQRYQDSMQWRAYLFAFGASQFMYNILQMENNDGVWFVKANEQAYMSDYPTMGLDVVDMVHELYEFTKKHKLTDYLVKEAT
jgi:hypothetical protein